MPGGGGDIADDYDYDGAEDDYDYDVEVPEGVASTATPEATTEATPETAEAGQ